MCKPYMYLKKSLSCTEAATAHILLLSVHLKVFSVKDKPKFCHNFSCVSGYSLKIIFYILINQALEVTVSYRSKGIYTAFCSIT